MQEEPIYPKHMLICESLTDYIGNAEIMEVESILVWLYMEKRSKWDSHEVIMIEHEYKDNILKLESGNLSAKNEDMAKATICKPGRGLLLENDHLVPLTLGSGLTMRKQVLFVPSLMLCCGWGTLRRVKVKAAQCCPRSLCDPRTPQSMELSGQNAGW